MMRGRYWIVLAAVPAVLLAADIVYWRMASDRLRGGLKDWIAAQRSQGWEIESGPAALGGWPRAATVTVPSLHMKHTGSDLPGAFEWSSSGLTLSVPLYLPTDVDVSFHGPQHLRIGTVPDTVVTGDTMAAAVPLGQDVAASFTLRASGLRAEPASGPWHVTAGLLTARVALAGGANDGIVFTTSAEAIELPSGFRWALGRNISSLSAEGRLNGPFPPAGDIAEQARTWRDNGGSLEIGHLAMGWGPLGLTASATLALDDQLQPMGSGNARIVGYADTLDRLAAAGVLTKSAAIAAKAVLSLLAGTSDTDEPPEVDVPLTLQYRTLSMRQVPLVRLPELDWPAR
nr:DUF2125 domain-containing protein [uncultured Rhodopila sp.]